MIPKTIDLSPQVAHISTTEDFDDRHDELTIQECLVKYLNLPKTSFDPNVSNPHCMNEQVSTRTNFEHSSTIPRYHSRIAPWRNCSAGQLRKMLLSCWHCRITSSTRWCWIRSTRLAPGMGQVWPITQIPSLALWSCRKEETRICTT